MDKWMGRLKEAARLIWSSVGAPLPPAHQCENQQVCTFLPECTGSGSAFKPSNLLPPVPALISAIPSFDKKEDFLVQCR